MCSFSVVVIAVVVIIDDDVGLCGCQQIWQGFTLIPVKERTSKLKRNVSSQ